MEQDKMKKKSKTLLCILIIGYSFMYLPLILTMLYSFNASRVINVWTGFSLKWYKIFFENEEIISAALNSFKIAAISATIASLTGTIAAIAVYKVKAFRKFLKLFLTPLIIPDVVLGFALLLLFVSLEKFVQLPSRSCIEVVIAHVTLSIAYIISIVYSRLNEIDSSLEEAAMDLGATPFKAFFVITLPIILPSICLGWLLSFMLSIDDVVLASFVSGPGVITLPMIVFSSIRFGISPQINVLTTIFMFVLSIGTIFIARFILKRKK